MSYDTSNKKPAGQRRQGDTFKLGVTGRKGESELIQVSNNSTLITSSDCMNCSLSEGFVDATTQWGDRCSRKLPVVRIAAQEIH